MTRRSLLIIIALCTTSAALAAPKGVPKLPPKAYHIEDYTVPGSETLQASFRVKSPFPASGSVSHYAKGVSPDWAACRTSSPAWEAYVDKSSGQQQLVHQAIRYWVSHKQKKMLTVIVRHYSKGSKPRCKPDSDVEHAVVVVSMSPDLSNEIELLKLSCGVDVPAKPSEIPPPATCR